MLQVHTIIINHKRKSQKGCYQNYKTNGFQSEILKSNSIKISYSSLHVQKSFPKNKLSQNEYLHIKLLVMNN